MNVPKVFSVRSNALESRDGNQAWAISIERLSKNPKDTTYPKRDRLKHPPNLSKATTRTKPNGMKPIVLIIASTSRFKTLSNSPN